jgi:uncharacterized membrane protein YbhN (UPF0104 family)
MRILRLSRHSIRLFLEVASTGNQSFRNCYTIATMDMKKIRSAAQKFLHLSFVQFIVRHRKTIGIIVIVAFFAFLVYYLLANPDVLRNVVKIGPERGIALLVFYFFVVLTNCGIMVATVRLCKKHLPTRSGLLLTMYSSVVNFFGPLQSGPGVRAVYLKTKIGLRIRDYTYAMLFYYFAFAALNVSLMFINTAAWLSTLGIIAMVVLIAAGTQKLGFGHLKKYVFAIFILTLLQVLCMVVIYTIELNAVDPSAHYTILQTISYTSSANLSLFVSLTPGGIGIREAFLIFSESLHHIPLSSIISAGILDRAFYIIFVILLFVVSTGLNLKDMFTSKKNA